MSFAVDKITLSTNPRFEELEELEKTIEWKSVADIEFAIFTQLKFIRAYLRELTEGIKCYNSIVEEFNQKEK